jgi:hypothetical protein
MTAAHTHTEPGKTFAQALPRLESYGMNATYCNWVMCGVVVGVGEYGERPSQLGSVSVRLRYSSSSSLDADADGGKKNNWATQKCPVEKYFF